MYMVLVPPSNFASLATRWLSFIALLLIAIKSPSLKANVVTLGSDTRNLPLVPHSRILEDRTGEVQLADIVSGRLDEQFFSEEGDVANFGFTGFAYWFQFDLENQNLDQDKWYLSVEYSLLNYIDLYYQDENGSWQHRKTGSRREFASREIKHRFFYFLLDLPTNEARRYYLRVQTAGTAEIPLLIKHPEVLAELNHERQFGQGIFVGLILVMVLYYLAIYIGSRTIEYFLFSAFMFSMFIMKGSISGVTQEYLWSNWNWWSNAVVAMSVPLAFCVGTIYSWKFLNIREHKYWNWTYFGVMGVLGFFTFASFFLPYSMLETYTKAGLLTSIILITSSIYVYLKGFKPARFFILSWTAMLIGSLAFGLQKLGVLPVSFWTTYGVEISLGLQAILLAVGQSDKINRINSEIRAAQKKALEAQIETNRVTEIMKNKLEELVEERTADLWMKTKDIQVMMDNIHQGVFQIDGNLEICGEYSTYLEEIVESTNLQKRSLSSLLIERLEIPQDEKDMIINTIEAIIDEDVMNFEANHHVFPKEAFAQFPKTKRYLEMDWAPIENQDNCFERIMVTVRDTTEARALKAAAEKQQSELNIIGQILQLSAIKFQSFIGSSFELIDHCRMIISDGLAEERWNIILRYVHTIKGNARTYGLQEIAKTVHIAEDYLFSLDRNKLDKVTLTRVEEELNKITKSLETYQDISVRKLGRGAASDAESVLSGIWSLIKNMKKDGVLNRYMHDEEAKTTIAKLSDLTSDTFQATLSPIIRSLPSLAGQLGKKTPQVVFRGEEFSIEKPYARLYEDTFVHLIRNSLDHGFLPHQQGEIVIDVDRSGGTCRITYQDSGRGLNIKRLKSKGLELGILKEDSSENEIANTIFFGGVSSAEKVTDISGRGVGMEAVMGFVEQLKGSIKIELLDHPAEQNFKKFRFVIEVPIYGEQDVLAAS